MLAELLIQRVSALITPEIPHIRSLSTSLTLTKSVATMIRKRKDVYNTSSIL